MYLQSKLASCTCFVILCSNSFQAVMGKNINFVNSGNVVNMNFVDLLRRYHI
jgi:hypothetical protein